MYDSFYNRVSRSDIAEKVNNPHTHTTPANNSFELVVRFPEIAHASSSLLGCCNHHHHHAVYVSDNILAYEYEYSTSTFM